MNDPFAILGIQPTDDTDAVRHAYHQLARRCHPDQFHDEEDRQAAHERMAAINKAYEEAMRLASSRRTMPYTAPIPCEDAVAVARKMLTQRGPESALCQLLRAESRSAEWFALQGEILMAMEQYDSAEQSWRQAVRMEPNNVIYRRGALAALVARRNANSLRGRVRKLFGRRNRK